LLLLRLAAQYTKYTARLINFIFLRSFLLFVSGYYSSAIVRKTIRLPRLHTRFPTCLLRKSSSAMCWRNSVMAIYGTPIRGRNPLRILTNTQVRSAITCNLIIKQSCEI